MTDKELLECAAKAAGIVIDYSHNSILGGRKTGFDLVGSAVLDWHNGTKWNPLTDDGDAFRLAVRLNLLTFTARGIVTANASDRDGPCIREVFHDDADQYAATRRAIVRAAASIGVAK